MELTVSMTINKTIYIDDDTRTIDSELVKRSVDGFCEILNNIQEFDWIISDEQYLTDGKESQ